MDRHDAVIFIVPNIGEPHNKKIFNRNLNNSELKFLGDSLSVGYHKKHNSYEDCIKDIKSKLQKIKKILEE
jgi:hypothetical protein